VVSSKNLFLCSPPKIVFALRPDSWAMFMKLTPSDGVAGGAGGRCGATDDCLRRAKSGQSPARTFSSDRTRAERLRDLRNLRRGKNNRTIPFRSGPEADWLLSDHVACYTLAVSFIDSVAKLCKRGMLSKSFSCKSQCDHSFAALVR
jgi:hypothetical protein